MKADIECPLCGHRMREELGSEIVRGNEVRHLFRCPNCLHEERPVERKGRSTEQDGVSTE